MSSSEEAAWVQAAAACVQAVVTVAVVWWAAGLQARSQTKREKAELNRRLEGAAAAALLALYVWKRVEARAGHDGMDPQTFLGVYRPAEFEAALRALREVRVAEFGDYTLALSMLELEKAMSHAEGELEQEQTRARRLTQAVPAMSLVGKETTMIFNAAASVERRVAELVGRAAREEELGRGVRPD